MPGTCHSPCATTEGAEEVADTSGILLQLFTESKARCL
jgi:hypothetical protein